MRGDSTAIHWRMILGMYYLPLAVLVVVLCIDLRRVRATAPGWRCRSAASNHSLSRKRHRPWDPMDLARRPHPWHRKRRRTLSPEDDRLCSLCSPPRARSSIRRVFTFAQPVMIAVTTKLREVLGHALEELLASLLSFVLCAVVVTLLRHYSTIVVGVSVDLGAFSIDI